jgi:hypothetical protein
VIYLVATLSGDRFFWLVYVDPRFGLAFWESAIRHTEVFPGITSWISAAVLFWVGMRLRAGSINWRSYLALEIALGGSTAAAFIIVLLGHLSPAHGISIPELAIPAAMAVAVSVIPPILAWRSAVHR